MPPAPDADSAGPSRTRYAAWVVVWVLAIALAALFDRHGAAFAKDFGSNVYPLKDSVAARVLKIPGEFLFTLAAAAIVMWVHPWKWRAGGLVCLSAIVGGALEALLKWTVGRRRPIVGTPFEFDLFIGGPTGLFAPPSNLTFPSGHAICAFATAGALAVLFPRWRWGFYALAAVTATERVVERAHYLSDVVAAAGVGILSVRVAIYVGNKLANRERPLETACERGQAEPAGPAGPR
jgi:membrane-associated phospholipid phosphatase